LKSHIDFMFVFVVLTLASLPGCLPLPSAAYWGAGGGAVAAMLGIGLYTVLVGPSPSVLRVAIMGCFALVARQLGRQTGINTLALTAAMMAGFNPSILWDPGFQLFFAATLGLVLYAEPLQTWFTNLLGRCLPPAHRPQWLDRAVHGWGADVGGGGEEVIEF
jgi:predicted membrane metal-binding protein